MLLLLLPLLLDQLNFLLLLEMGFLFGDTVMGAASACEGRLCTYSWSGVFRLSGRE